MKKVIATGKTIEDAVKSGLAQLNTTQDRVHVNVLEQPSKGFLGLIGTKEAKVELEKIPDPIEEAVLFLEELFDSMGLAISIDQKQTKDAHMFNLSGSELGILIGKRGQTLDALQYLVNIVANRYSNAHVRILLDAEQFRERRKQTLQELANRLAGRVTRSKKDLILEPMNAQERKIIHSELQSHPSVKTYSKGEEPSRRVVITLR
ncbi:RNA-binding cell elongation regulator Jag/EloR [Paenibacillus sp. FJAT-26967]|uniref:RNA-binding cell elongation regulator Jag/EloR n=1 Tax=Paenibacillus sp. FJAT-26967 TaxID=1729690 RepID=UPI00083897B8|nr:RNA-binding cell elongation regulator Jag/EloR [Paenibacillus sp. FJAT-26967]